MENKHQPHDLKQMQSLPLSAKVKMTRERVRQWYDHWDGEVSVSFSGGKDSTVLLDIVRNKIGYTDVPAVFVDTGLEYPEIREFVKNFDNVVWLKPNMNFKEVIETYGYPFISKEVSQCVYEVLKARSNGKDTSNYAQYRRLCGTYSEKGFMDKSKYKFLLDAPFWVSHKCCSVMKKKPIHDYEKESGRKPITAQMACESKLRRQKWLQNGCNAFEAKNPISNPMSFWTEQDVLEYIKTYDIPICSVYGNIIEDEKMNLKTTGCSRTGCMFCGFGCHIEKSPNRFEMMRETHPKQYEWIMKSREDGGLGYKFVIDWLNEHGNLNIKY